MLFGLLVFFLSIFLAVYCCCCRKATGQQPFFQGRVLSRKSNRGKFCKFYILCLTRWNFFSLIFQFTLFLTMVLVE